MIEIVNKFEKGVYAVLMALLMLVLLGSLLDLVWLLYDALIFTTPALLETRELIAVLGAFLLVLIGVELLDTIKAYFRENSIHVEIVVLLAIIAVARKVILLDPTGRVVSASNSAAASRNASPSSRKGIPSWTDNAREMSSSFT